MAKIDTIADCKLSNFFSSLPALVLLTGAIFFAILPNAWSGQNPKVTSVSFRSTGPYVAGNNIEVDVQFDEMLEVTGTPQLTLTIGETEKTANYYQLTGSQTMGFRYTVAAEDTDTDGVAVKANSLSLNEGTIQSIIYKGDAVLSHSAKDGGTHHAVDTTIPTVSSVAFSSTGPYIIGSGVKVKVTMSENVVVDDGGGTPSLTLLVGTAEKKAKYDSGTGTSALVFTYTVAAGDGDDADGPAVKVNSLSLNGGTISDAAGNDATLTHTAVADAGSSHAIESSLPKVSSVAFTSTGPYVVGDNIDVTVTMSENMKVDTTHGTPQLTLVVGTTEKQAKYDSGTGTKALVFRYTVAAGDTDTDGVAVKKDSLSVNKGTIKDSAGNLAFLLHSAQDAGSSHKVDTTVPTVSFLSIINTGPYKSGDLIKVTATFSEDVIITGTPQLTFVIGTTEKKANYTRQPQPTELLFQYTVADGDTDTDGYSVKANSLALNGGTIKDSAGNAATLTHSASDNTGNDRYRVDTTAPTVSSVAFSSTGPYKVGSNIDVTLTTSENVSVETLNGTPTLTFVVGTTEKTAKHHSGSETKALVFRYTVVAGDADTDGVSVKVNSLSLNSGTMKDETGNDLTLTHSALADGGNTHIVDTTIPTVSSLVFTSTGIYKAGSNINVKLTTSENITVTGTPNLTLRVGSSDKTASYNSGTGTTALVFQYTVADGDNDTDGVSVNANSLSLNSGTLKDETGNDLTLTHSALADGGDNHIVDTTVPTVSSLAFSSTGIYKAGSNIDVTVTMSENVNVDTTNGTPQLTLVVGTTEKQANYNSGTGATQLVFRYTVAAGNNDTDGVSVKVNSLSLNSGTINDLAGNPATLTHSALADGGDNQAVDTTAPTVKTISVNPGPFKVGDNIDVKVTMSENVDVTGTPTLILIIGTTEKTANYTSGSTTSALVFRYTVVAGDTDPDGVAVKANSLNLNSGTIKDSIGNAAILGHGALEAGGHRRVDTTVPTVSSIAFSSTGPYKVGDNIDVTVTTSENVSVFDTPTLTLIIGTTEKTANYISGSTTSALVFKYTVAAGDADTDGVAVKANSLSGGTIWDDSTNLLNRTHSALDGGDNHRVDTTAPTVSSLAFTSIGTYSTESVIEVTLTMSENVTVTGTPQLTLIIDKAEKKANYVSGSETNALVFRYTVATGDGKDTDGVSVKKDSLALNGGTINDIINPATLTHAVLNGGVGHSLDTTLLKVNTVNFSSTGPYKVGSNIEVTVTTTKPVTVTGDATLRIVIGSTEKTASYNRRSGTHALVFRYIVAAEDGNDTDGVSVKANSLTGNSILDSSSTALNTNHDGVDGGTDHAVDTTPPTVTSVTFSGTGPYRINSTIDVTVTMSENVTVDTTGGTPRLTLVVGTADKLINYVSGTGTTALLFQYTVTSADSDDDDGVSVKANSLDLNSGTIKDNVGNTATLTHDAVAASNSHRVDITDPQVSAVAFSSTGPYKAGNNIDVTLTMSEDITVAGTPQLTLVIGSAEKTANYNGGSGTSALIFRYTVAAGDTDTDGASVKVNSLTRNGGTMQDSVGNDLTLTHTTANGGNSHRIDTTAPTVSALAFTSTGPYSTGNNIDVKLTVSETVDVDITDGTPSLTFVVGTEEKTANYNSGTETTDLVFRYTVATGDTDTDGVAVKANSLALNGGTMQDSVGNDLTRTHSAVDADNSQRVDTTAPAVRSIAFTSTGPYNVGANIDVTLTTSKNITVTGTPQLTLVVGTTEKTANYNSGNGTDALVFRYTVLAGDNDTDGVSVKLNSLKSNGGTLKDSVSNDLTLTHSAADADSSHRVDTAAPTVGAIAFTSTGPYNVGHDIDVTLTMSETVSVTGTPQLTIVIGTTEKTASYDSGTGTEALVFRYTVVEADSEDTDGVSVKANSLTLNGGTIKDKLRNDATLTHVAVADAGDSHRVDKTAPTVSSVEIASTGPYGVGSNIVVKATMSETVDVIGTPRLILVLGTTERTAEYTSGTGTKILLFQYTVQTGDADADGISVKQDSLTLTAPNRRSLSDGIRDAADNSADLAHDAVADAGTTHVVDTAPPMVSAIAFTSTGPYNVGANIDVTLTVNKNVTVTGTPTLTLEVGSDEKTANYHTGTGSTELVFRYTVVKGDTDTDGASVIASSLDLNGGSITDTSGIRLNLAHTAVTGDTNHVVDTLPVIRSIAFTSTGPYEINSNIDITVTISKNVTVTGTPTLTLAVGDAEKTANYYSGTRTNALVFRYTVVKGDMDPDGVSVKADSVALNDGSITDQFGSRLTRTHQAVDGGNSHSVDTILPEVSSIAFVSTGPYSIGNSIEVAVTTTKDVTVTGNATLKIIIGNTMKTANYHRRSRTNALVFRYTVTNGDSDDTDGVSVRANSLSSNGGSIVDASNKALNLNHDGIDGGIGHRVDTTVPAVRSIAFTSTGPYNIGDRIDIAATISKAVTVTGTPTLTLIIGTAEKRANYYTGTGTTQLNFRYTVTAGDVDMDGVSVKVNSLALNDGNIVDAFGGNLTLAHDSIAGGVSHRVDTILPEVRSLAFTSTGPYSIGSTIEVTAAISKIVTVTGTPTLTIVVGNTEKTANYHTGTGTTQLTFRYTVADGDAEDTNGVSVNANSLSLNGGTIVDGTGNNLNRNHGGIPDAGDTHRVDTILPEVRSITFTSTGPYSIGSNIEVTVTTTKPVTVVGNATLQVLIGNTTKTADYHGGSGTNTLLFRYTVTVGDNDDSDGVSVRANSLSLNGGSIVDASNNALNLNHDAIDGGLGHRVDTTLPSVRSLTFTSTGPYGIGDRIEVTATISKIVTVTGTPTLTITVGTTQKTANYTLGSGTNALIFQYTVAAGDNDTDGVSVKEDSLNFNGGSILDEFRNNLSLNHNAVAGDVRHRVDTILPEVRSLAFTSTGPYGGGNTIEVTATTNKIVTVTGTPTLSLVIGTAEKTASYYGGSGTTEIVFRYIVAAGDMDPDGASVSTNALNLNGGTIVDGTGSNLNRNHGGIPDAGDTHRVDTSPPKIHSLAFTSTGPYDIGSTIEVAVTISKIVTVTGTPTLTLVIGTTEKTANYYSGSGTTEIVFRYTVATGDGEDMDGVSVNANALNLNGGTIVDASGSPLNRNHGGIPDAGDTHRVDTILPEVRSLTFTSTGPYTSWDDIEVTVTTTKPVTVTGNATLQVVIGNTAKTANYHSGSRTNALVFQYTVTNGDIDPDGVSVRANSLNLNGGSIIDASNNALNLNHDALSDAGDSQRVDTKPPKVDSVAFTSTGPYGVGNIIQVAVTTNEVLMVRGTPTLTIIIGNKEKIAQYYMDFNPHTLAFQYTVVAGDGNDTNGVSVRANSLNLNGGIITDFLGNNLDVKHDAVADGGDSQVVGTTVSGIRSLAFTSTGPYKINDIITVTVQTTEKVNVTGIPRIPMIFGTGTKYANYVSGSGTTSLVFQYIVVDRDGDADGIEIAPNTLGNNEGSTIKSDHHTDVNLNHAGVHADPSQTVDTTLPRILSVDFGDTAATYAVGDEIEVVVTFEETGVQVNPAADGTLPSVELLLGSNASRSSQKTTVEAPYKESRPGSTKLVFTYTVTEDTPMDVDGVQIKRDGLMIPAGASIQDASGNAIQSIETDHGQLTVLPRASTRISSPPIIPSIVSTSVIFNEFLNANSDKQDWVELRNLSETDIDLGDWKITISTGQARNDAVKFPDMTLPAGEVLLLINTPHKDTRLALSKHFSYRYLVMPELRLPQNAFMLTLQNKSGAITDIMGSYLGSDDVQNTATFERDQAYTREQPSASGYETTAWILSGYHAGLGYDRNVPEETSPGTPGYLKPVSIPQSEIATVSISEIMYTTGESGKLPQWIELYNASKTRIISMRGWKLQLEISTGNAGLSRYFSAFVIQDSLQILPNQTVLIVTKGGRNSKHFPEPRVYNLTEQHPEDIKKLNLEDGITEVTGFAVALSDDRGTPIDLVGNLDGQSGTNDEPSWKLLNGITPNGNRSSIIRQYEDGAPLTGTNRSSWFRASTIKRTIQTYWGHPKDAGNPGWKKGTVLPVQLSSFKAERTDAGAVITWYTESELENAGFNILRSETKNGTFTIVNPKLIPGAGTTAERSTYQYIDTGTKPGQHYYYQLEDVSFTGIRQTLTTQRLRRNISPVGQRLTTFGAIKKGNR